jgi:hypothetical protein
MLQTPGLITADELSCTESTSAQQHLLRGSFRYYHYGNDSFADHGWGCGYRTVQCMLSWLAPSPPPPIPQLQEVLLRTHAAAFPGVRGWIGVNDAVVLLDALHGAAVQVLTVSSGAEAIELFPKLAEHFDAGGGPVMVGSGGDPYSKTLVGVRIDQPAVLVLDPHYSGPSLRTCDEAESLKALWDGGWIAWKDPATCFPSTSFYNFGLAAMQPGKAQGAQVLAPTSRAAARSDEGGWAHLFEVVGRGERESAVATSNAVPSDL